MGEYDYRDQLESLRLITRKVVPGDYVKWSRFFENAEATRFHPELESLTPEERAKKWIARQISRYNNRQYGLQALIHKESNSFIGMCGLLIQEINNKKEVEIGYHLIREHWGKGYAIEAATLFKNYAFINQIPSVTSIIHILNTRSQNVAIKNGMTCEEQLEWSGKEVFIYRVNQS